MDMIKYIVKRLLLSIVILLGVSVIIYSLARMMPTNYVEGIFSSALTQGTMTQEDVDKIIDLYGLSMPDAYLTVKPGEGSKFSGQEFTKSTKASIRDEDIGTYENVVALFEQDLLDTSLSEAERAEKEKGLQNAIIGLNEQFAKWYIGDYNGKNDIRLKLNKDGTYIIGKVQIFTSTQEGAGDSDGEKEDSTGIKVEEKFVVEESGTFELNAESRGIKGIILHVDGGESAASEVNYRVASGWNKFVSLLKGYFGWLGKLMQGDLGLSFKYKKPVGDVIMQNMGISFAIAFIATILQFVISIPLGIKAAVNQYGVIDYTVTVFTMIGISLPTFFLGALFIRVFAVGLGWFPVTGIMTGNLPVDTSWIARLGDILWHMILPMAVLVILSIGSLMRYTRTNTLEALNADYVRTARAKGLSEKTVIYKHAFRNTLIPLVTMMAGILPGLFGGAMITETVFEIPGIGKLAYDALVVADVPFIMGYNMFIAILTVIGTLLSDLMYAVVDPRVKLS